MGLAHDADLLLQFEGERRQRIPGRLLLVTLLKVRTLLDPPTPLAG